jgi:hypothetical protein
MLATRPTYRPILAVDIEKSGGRGDVALQACRGVLRHALDAALAASGIAWKDCHHNDIGDGFRIVAKPSVSKESLLYPLVDRLADELRGHNQLAGELAVVRVRAVVHAGGVHVDDGQLIGGSLEHVARLLDAAPLRAALSMAPPTASVALAVSQHIHEEVVRHRYAGIDPDMYVPAAIQVKELNTTAWLRIPGHARLPLGIGMTSAGPDRSREVCEVSASGGTAAYVTGDAIVGRITGPIGNVFERVTGGVHIGGSSPGGPDLPILVEGLRRELDRWHDIGQIGPVVYEEAAAELDKAGKYALTPGDDGRQRFIVALQKFKGLIETIADLTTKVTTAIAAARGAR